MASFSVQRKSRISTEKPIVLDPEAEAEQKVLGDVALVKFSKDNEIKLKIVIGDQLTIDKPWKTVAKEQLVGVLKEMKTRGDCLKKLKTYIYEEVLIGFEVGLQAAEGHLVCITAAGRERILSELGNLHTTLTNQVRNYLNRSTLRRIQPHRHIAIETKPRPPIIYEWVGQIQSRSRRLEFGYSKGETATYSSILCRNKKSIQLVECAVQHAQVLATPNYKDCSVQTEPEIAINDYTQFLPEVDLPKITKLTHDQENKLARVCNTYSNKVMEAVGYNSLFDLYKDDYSELVNLGRPLTISKLASYKHYMSFTDLSQYEGKILNDITCHPTSAVGAVAVAYGNLSVNNIVKLESDSEDENYVRRKESDIWMKDRKETTIADKDTTERTNWMMSVKRIDQLIGQEYSETQWAAAEQTLNSIEMAMRLRDYEIRCQKIEEELIPNYDAGPEEYNMYYLPYGDEVEVDTNRMKALIHES